MTCLSLKEQIAGSYAIVAADQRKVDRLLKQYALELSEVHCLWRRLRRQGGRHWRCIERDDYVVRPSRPSPAHQHRAGIGIRISIQGLDDTKAVNYDVYGTVLLARNSNDAKLVT